MMARSVRARKGDHVMIAAVDAVQEGDIVAGMIGQPHAEHAGIELDRLADIGGEHQHMRQAPRPCPRHGAAERRSALTGSSFLVAEAGLLVGR
jgi:hypothetical protein